MFRTTILIPYFHLEESFLYDVFSLRNRIYLLELRVDSDVWLMLSVLVQQYSDFFQIHFLI